MKYVLVALKDELDGHNMNEGEYMVWYTGVGKINATIYATLACLSKDCTEVINYGTAGSQKKEHVGNLLKVGICHQRDMDARPTAELGITPYEATGLEGPLKIDDKGAAFKKKCTIYKYVSDLADSNAAEHWSENLSKGKDAFLSTV